MRRLLTLALVMVLSHLVTFAGPVCSRKQKVTLPDGRTVEVKAVGDEFFHCFMTDDNVALRQVSKGRYEVIPQRELELLRSKAAEERRLVNEQRSKKMQRRVGTINSGLKGTKRGLVILVNYTNQKFSVVDNPKEFYKRLFNEPGFSEYAFHGSVRDYFLEQSYGEFAVDFDVVGPYELSHSYSFYGGHSGNGHDARAPEMAWEALLLADRDVNYADYDWDGDRSVEQVYIIYAGYGENYGGNNPDFVWAHSSTVENVDGFRRLDGVTLGTYACNCEVQGWEENEGKPGYEEKLPEGIGSACHEFSHCLGYPDFYNTQGTGGYNMQSWDVLGGGSYNGADYKGRHMSSVCPASYTAYERWAAGWLKPVELDKETRVTGMKALNKAPEAYVMYNDANHDEYYLLENRQLDGFDKGLPGHGLLVTHVTYDKSAWTSNSVNTEPSNQRMTIIAADNRYGGDNVSADVFPGTKGVTSLTDQSHGATLNTKNTDDTYYMHKALEYIQEDANGLISFLACRPGLMQPSVRADKVSATSFKVSWDAVPGAEEYEVEMTEYAQRGSVEDALRLKETFSKCYKSSAGFTDIAGSLSTYLDNSGFSGTALYQSPNYLKIGTTSKNGVLKSPTFRATETGSVTIVLGVAPGTEGKEVKGSMTVVMNSRDNVSASFAFTSAGYIVLHPNIVTDDIFRLDLQPQGMMYLNYMAVYDGNFSAEELGVSAMNEVKEQKQSPALSHRAPAVKNTKDTSLTFTDMNVTSTYEIRVRAKDDTRTGEWSEALTFTLADGTAVKDIVPAGKLNDAFYSLDGRKVTRPSNGIYIHGGKKVMVK